MTEYYKTYGDYKVDDNRAKDPYFVCVMKDSLLSDSNTYLGPASEPCFEYMTDRCSNQMKNGYFDEACMAYLTNEYNSLPDIHKPLYNEDPRNSEIPMYNTPTVGELSRRGVAEKAFCRVVNNGDSSDTCQRTITKFDPTQPESPSYNVYSGSECGIVCDQWNPEDLRDNSLIDKLTEDKTAEPFLKNICQSAVSSGKTITNQKLLNFCNNKMEKKDLIEGYGDQPVGILEDGFQRDMFMPRTSVKEAFRSKYRAGYAPRNMRKEAYQPVKDMNQNFQLLGNRREGYGDSGDGMSDCTWKMILVLLIALTLYLIFNMKKENM